LTNEEDTAGAVQDPVTGALDRGWVEVTTVWAAIKPVSARNFLAAGAPQGEFNEVIVTRYNSLIADASNLRAVHVLNGADHRVYSIAGPQRDQESGLEHLSFPAKAGVTNGE
jgi:SPP1 family predicted phage head-tail adaptor